MFRCPTVTRHNRFTSVLNGTINVNVSNLMSEAPAVFRNTSGMATSNSTSALVVSRPLTINGSMVGTTLAPAIPLDSGLLTNAAVDGRMMVVNDGDSASDMRVVIFGPAFAKGRTFFNAGGCLFSRESLTLNTVSFTNNKGMRGGASTARAAQARLRQVQVPATSGTSS